MNWYKIFYWLTVAESAKVAFIVVALVGLVGTIILTIGVFVSGSQGDSEYKDWQPISRRVYRTCLFLMFFFGLLAILTPTKTDCLLIIAGGSVGNFITSDSSSKAIPADITRFLHMRLQSEIADGNDDIKRQLGLQTPKEVLLDKVKDLTKEQLLEYLKKDSTLIK